MAVIYPTAPGASTAGRNPARGALLAGTFCSVFEWFDLILGGMIARELFDQTPSRMSYALFAVVPVLARLVGAAVVGGYGDRAGRKAALLVTLLLMSTASLLLGLMAVVEFRDLTTLLMLRVMQGLAIGGAWAGCVCLALEWADQPQKSRFAAWPQIGVPAGFALAQLTSLLLWPGLWLPCLVAAAVGLCAAAIVWNKAPDSPALINHGPSGLGRSPLVAAIRHDYRRILLVSLLRAAEIVAFFVFTGLVFSYPAVRQALSVEAIALAVSAACLLASVFVPLFGGLSDRHGPATIYLIGVLATGAWAFAYIALLNTAVPALVLTAIVVSLLPYAAMAGPQAALIVESFVAPRRYGGASLGTQLGAVIAAIPAPVAAGLLLSKFASGYAIAWLILGCCGVSVFAALALRQAQTPRRLKSAPEATIHLVGPTGDWTLFKLLGSRAAFWWRWRQDRCKRPEPHHDRRDGTSSTDRHRA